MEDIEVKIKLNDLIEIQNKSKLYDYICKERDEYKEKYEKLLNEKEENK